MSAVSRLRAIAAGASLAASAAGFLSLSGTALPPLAVQPAQAQGTPGLVEFRWDNNRDFRKLYYFMTDTARLKRSEYYLILKPKDRKTAMLKLTINVPSYWQAEFNPKLMKLCVMNEGGMMARTSCKETIPATIEVSKNGQSIEVFPNTPVPDNKTVGLYMIVFNPFNAGMYQFNALIQPPGDIPVSSYVGSWLIQIDPN
ncbi:MAG: DUF2808 domain-containing protein [Cyanobium sp.]